jgi:DNA replication ATP-dependent helicase Dna2
MEVEEKSPLPPPLPSLLDFGSFAHSVHLALLLFALHLSLMLLFTSPLETDRPNRRLSLSRSKRKRETPPSSQPGQPAVVLDDIEAPNPTSKASHSPIVGSIQKQKTATPATIQPARSLHHHPKQSGKSSANYNAKEANSHRISAGSTTSNIGTAGKSPYNIARSIVRQKLDGKTIKTHNRPNPFTKQPLCKPDANSGGMQRSKLPPAPIPPAASSGSVRSQSFNPFAKTASKTSNGNAAADGRSVCVQKQSDGLTAAKGPDGKHLNPAAIQNRVKVDIAPSSKIVEPENDVDSDIDLDAILFSCSIPTQTPPRLTHPPVEMSTVPTTHPTANGTQTTNPVNPPPSSKRKRTFVPFSRFLVLDVVRNHYTPLEPPAARPKEELILRLFDERLQQVKHCHLRQDWSRTRVDAGDFVHVTGDFEVDSVTCFVDNVQNFVVVHPDVLLTGTRIADSFDCSRKAVLSERFNTLGGSSFAMIQGTMLHEVFEICVRSRDFQLEQLQATVAEVVQKHLSEVFACSETEETAGQKLGDFLPLLQQWATEFLREDPVAEVRFQLPNRPSAAQGENSHKLCVSKVLDIEENIWCPQFGIKGKVDASVEVTIHTVRSTGRGGRPAGSNIISSKKAVVPLELKTGRVTDRGMTSHRAQVILYMLMMDGRYGTAVEEGLLLYIKSGQSFGLPLDQNDTRALLIARNELAHYVTEKTKLPEMLRNPNSCRRCFQLTNCTLAHAALENGDAESSGLFGLYRELTSHLNEAHLNYFRGWCEMITLEYSPNAAQKDIWAMTSWEREQTSGTCFSSMMLVAIPEEAARSPIPKQTSSNRSNTTDSKYYCRFQRHESHPGAASARSGLTDLRIGTDDQVVVSTDNGSRVAFTFGKVTELTADFVLVATDTKVGPLDGLFRLDRDMSSYGMKIALSNVARLFVPAAPPEGSNLPARDLERLAKHRRTIVDLGSPVFESPPDDHVFKMKALVEKSNMNSGQRKAMASALSAKDYSLILGMPGTGKTTTITRLVDLLVQCGKTVLIASYTHSAVDNILLKLQEEQIDFLRVGPVNRIHPDIRARHADAVLSEVRTTAGLKEAYDRYNVVASTCLGVKHPIFEYRRFDYCIIDEASQITQPVSLGPIAMADTFILVGDHYQLPPLVQSDEARAKGMGISLFRRLSEAQPRAIVELEEQYRMNSSVMRIANAMIYSDRLKCGTADVASAHLALPGFDAWRKTPTLGATATPADWLIRCIDPKQSVAFLDTVNVPAAETRVGHLVRNDVEARLVVRLVESLSAAGLADEAIGVISPYRMQLQIIRQQMGGRFDRVEVNTIDKYQGRDKECIILSLVRSNSSGAIGSLLKDWRRVNVSVTRAKQKLLIVGDGSTLVAAHLFKQMLEVVDAEDWRQRLPCGAHT